MIDKENENENESDIEMEEDEETIPNDISGVIYVLCEIRDQLGGVVEEIENLNGLLEERNKLIKEDFE